eukprot:gene40162-60823_t
MQGEKRKRGEQAGDSGAGAAAAAGAPPAAGAQPAADDDSDEGTMD